MKLVSSFDISKNEHLAGVRFDDTKAYALTTSGKLYQINLSSPSQPRLENSIEGDDLNLFYYPLNEKTAFTINADVAAKGYKLNFYNIDEKGITPWKQEGFEIKYSNFSYFPVIEAINNRNAIFTADILGKYYLGFAVTNFNLTKGEYLLLRLIRKLKLSNKQSLSFLKENFRLEL